VNASCRAYVFRSAETKKAGRPAFYFDVKFVQETTETGFAPSCFSNLACPRSAPMNVLVLLYGNPNSRAVSLTMDEIFL
jgi:hypothetical protein